MKTFFPLKIASTLVKDLHQTVKAKTFSKILKINQFSKNWKKKKIIIIIYLLIVDQ